MEFFCYHRDRPGSTPLRSQMVEQHWSYMDRFAATMIARGPTFTSDGTLTGSVHILDLPDPTAARAFAFEEPGYQAGAYRDVLLRRWRNSLDRTMWDFSGGRPDNNRYLVLGFTLEPVADATELTLRDDLIASGPLWPMICALPVRQRAVIVLRYYEDLSEQEIADVLGCSTGSVKSQAHDALASLRRSVAAQANVQEEGVTREP